ncbi:WD40/YVTN/BNR-like repeat-containing protein [Halopseudomonas bauzanensis]|nr:YCF48-related protein [Halopseudomonas bauzanensis]
MNKIFQRVLTMASLPTGLMVLLLLMPASLLAAFRDPLDTPAEEFTRLAERPTQAVAKAGDVLVAVGARGLIATSRDGQNWQQSSSPVQSDLLAVVFPTPEQGWAVGHDGVILHSTDAGRSWAKQLDGRQAGELFTDYYASLQGDPELVDSMQSAVALNYGSGPTLPLLDVWFADAQRGFAVGSFGTLVATRDGGRTWEPWLHRIDNPDLLNLNAIQGVGDALYIAAEQGVVFRLGPQSQQFEMTETGYEGSFFGLLGVGNSVVAYGLSGTAYRSDNHGADWTPLHNPSGISLTAGATLPGAGDFVLTNARGDLLFGNIRSDRLQPQRGKGFARYTGVTALGGERLVITSLEGIRGDTLSAPARQ